MWSSDFGFFSGLGCGLLVAKLELDRISLADQQRAGGFALLLIAVAWAFALG